MLTVLIANAKGGCGKTTIATNLACAFAVGGANTALADCDRQGSSLMWLKARNDRAAAIHALDWRKDMTKVPKSISRLVIDTAAGLRKRNARDMLEMADVVVVPISPSAFDQRATERFLKRLQGIKRIAKGKLPVAVVANRMRRNTRSAKRTAEFLERLQTEALATVRDSARYVDMSGDGSGVFDRADKTGLTLRGDWLPLISFLEQLDIRR